MSPRIHITGASGSGTTTLGLRLAEQLGLAHLDSDSFFWIPTDPPFTTQRPVPERVALMGEAVATASSGWVISGSLVGWGESLIADADLVVFLYVATEQRMERILRREAQRYGAAILPGGSMHEGHVKFMDWAKGYDDSAFVGRNLAVHRAWLAARTCPVLEIVDAPSVDESARRVVQALGARGSNPRDSRSGE